METSFVFLISLSEGSFPPISLDRSFPCLKALSLPYLDYDGDFGSHVSLLNEGSREQLDQLEFEKEESRSKYEELKNEYVGLREKYRGVTSKYERLQNKAREQFDSYKLVITLRCIHTLSGIHTSI